MAVWHTALFAYAIRLVTALHSKAVTGLYWNVQELVKGRLADVVRLKDEQEDMHAAKLKEVARRCALQRSRHAQPTDAQRSHHAQQAAAAANATIEHATILPDQGADVEPNLQTACNCYRYACYKTNGWPALLVQLAHCVHVATVQTEGRPHTPLQSPPGGEQEAAAGAARQEH
jgi:hypothetical protein